MASDRPTISSVLRQRIDAVIAAQKAKVHLMSPRRMARQDAEARLEILFKMLCDSKDSQPVALEALVDAHGECHSACMIAALRKFILKRTERKCALFKEKKGYILKPI